MQSSKMTFYEFFAGGGMARLGMGRRWQCIFANDCCEKKARAYRANFERAPELLVRDIRKLTTDLLPAEPTLVWASFPCQDLSLAGNGVGLKGERSGTFWPFWRLMGRLAREGRGARLIVLENVVGAISSNKGQDFQAIIEAIAEAGYLVGALVINAMHFVPQSRPRLFIVAAANGAIIPERIKSDFPDQLWHSATLCAAHARFPRAVAKSWVWWQLPFPSIRRGELSELIEENPTRVTWHTSEETKRLLAMMSNTNRRKVEQASQLHKTVIGTIYRRTRPGDDGRRVQRAEVRFDQVSGCLRTPVGGSSRQTILVVQGGSIRSRLLSPREAARLMGVPDSYALPETYNEAYHLMGDGLVVPVVRWLETQLLHPLARAGMRSDEEAA